MTNRLHHLFADPLSQPGDKQLIQLLFRVSPLYYLGWLLAWLWVHVLIAPLP